MLELEANNRKESLNGNVSVSNSHADQPTMVMEYENQNKEKSMQQTIEILQRQIKKSINLVTESTQSVTSDDEKKLEIMQKMKDIRKVETNNKNPEVQMVKIIKTDVQKNAPMKIVRKLYLTMKLQTIKMPKARHHV